MRARAAAPAKVTRPRVTGVLARRRLFRALDQRRPLVWVSAPPGAGKSVLVASYLAERKRPGLWYQLDAADGDVAGFFRCMAQAAGRTQGPRRLPLLRPEYWPTLGSFARRYFQDLYGRLPDAAVVVLDNYHEVPEASRLHEVVRVAVDELVRGIRLVVISRGAPPAELVSLRAGRAMATLGWPELKLRPEEARALARLRRPRLARETVSRLHDRTAGWAAGLLLMLESAPEDGPAGPDIVPTSDVFDYFAAEAFAHMPAATQEFLLQTAFLPRMTARLARELTGVDTAERILSSLSARHFFTERHLEAETAFQYHALFREFLLARARESLAPARLAQLKRRAATVLAAAGESGAAAALSRDESDWGALAELITREAPALVAQGRSQTLEEWCGWLPPERLAADPWVLYWRGTWRTPFAPAVALADFEQAFDLFEAQKSDVGLFNSWAAAVGTILYEWEDFTLLDPWLERLDDLRGRWPAWPSEAIETRVASTLFYALMFRRPEHPEIEAWADRAVALSRRSDVNRRMTTGFLVTTYRLWKGEPAKAAVALDLLRGLIRSPEASPLERLSAHVMEAYCHWHMVEVAECSRVVSEGLDLARDSGVHLLDAHLLAQGASGALIGGDLEGARAYLRKMAALVESRPGLHVSHYHFLAGWAAWVGGDNSLAREHLERALDLARRAGTPFPEIWNHVGLAHVLDESGRADEAESHLAAAVERSRALGSGLAEHMCLLAEARMALRAGDGPRGAAALGRAFALGRDRGYLASPWWHRDVMAALCARALEEGIEVEYARSIVRRHRLVPDQPPLAAEDWPWAVTVRALGDFRLDRDGRPLPSGPKAQQRPLLLLKAIVASGGRDVPEERVADALWPEAAGDAAAQALATTLHRLRSLLGDEQAVRLREHHLSLDPQRVWLDVWAFDRLLGQADRAARQGRVDDAVALTEPALALYRGPFLGAREPEPWAVSMRERLRVRFLRATSALGRWLADQDAERAVRCYERGLEVDDLAEDLYQGLMTCHRALGRPSDALAAYERCRRALARGLGVAPSAATEAIRRSLTSAG